MSRFRQYEMVRVARLLRAAGECDGWRLNKRPPVVGDVGCVVEIVQNADQTDIYVVESAREDGVPVWLGEFLAAELTPVVGSAVQRSPEANVRGLPRTSHGRNVEPMDAKDAKKVVLVSRSGYHPSRDALLHTLIARRVELFCVVGKDCRAWEDAMDALVAGPNGSYEWHVTTSSHPEESIDEVIAFAQTWACDAPDTSDVVEVVEV